MGGLPLNRNLQRVVVRIEISLELPRRASPAIGGKQRLSGSAFPERSSVAIETIEFVDKVIGHVADVQQDIARQFPLYRKVPELHVPALEFARGQCADGDVTWRRDGSRREPAGSPDKRHAILQSGDCVRRVSPEVEARNRQEPRDAAVPCHKVNCANRIRLESAQRAFERQRVISDAERAADYRLVVELVSDSKPRGKQLVTAGHAKVSGVVSKPAQEQLVGGGVIDFEFAGSIPCDQREILPPETGIYGKL